MGATHNNGPEDSRRDPAMPARQRSGAGAAPSQRAAAKAQRRTAILDSAMTLFAARGFKAVSIGDIGSGAGVSGPAVYRHFASKESILSELLINISQYLYDGGERITGGVLSGGSDTDNGGTAQHSDGGSGSGSRDPNRILRELIDFHLDFTASDPELIRIQDRDWSALPESSRREVRRLQRAYVSHWVKVLRAVHPTLAEDAATVRAHAVFGMLNSTPYVLRRRPQQVVENELRRGALALVAVG